MADFIISLIKIIAGLADYLASKRLLEQGKAQAVNDGLKQILANIEKAKSVKDELSNNPDGEYADRVRRKYTRPDE